MPYPDFQRDESKPRVNDALGSKLAPSLGYVRSSGPFGRLVLGMAAAFVGVLMLDTTFARPVGDIGNRNSFPGVPMRFARVANAFADRVLSSDPETGLGGLFPAFLKEALALQAQGAVGITTSCGFLAPLQHRLARELRVPVALSSLLQVAWAQSLLPPGKKVGVITIDAERLSGAHLASVGAAADTVIVGMPRRGAFAELILADSSKNPAGYPDKVNSARRKAIEAELVLAARSLPASTGAIILECTNLPPYRDALRKSTGLPIYDIQTLVQWFWAGLRA